MSKDKSDTPRVETVAHNHVRLAGVAYRLQKELIDVRREYALLERELADCRRELEQHKEKESALFKENCQLLQASLESRLAAHRMPGRRRPRSAESLAEGGIEVATPVPAPTIEELIGRLEKHKDWLREALDGWEAYADGRTPRSPARIAQIRKLMEA